MKKIIFLNGPPSCGKDTIANYMVHNYNAVNLKYAQPLRDITCALFGIKDSQIDARKNKPIDELKSGYRIRDFMIDVSEQIIKPNLDQDWFANNLLSKIKTKYYDERLLVISDLGFERECDIVYNSLKTYYTFELWKISRNGTDFSNDSRVYVYHPEIKTRLIVNDFSIETLQKMISEILKFLQR